MENKCKKSFSKWSCNPWKVSFLLLCGLIVVLIGTFYLSITKVQEPVTQSESISNPFQDSAFQVELTKAQANQLIQYYLNKHKEENAIQYNFLLENEASMTGTIPVFGHELMFRAYFDPTVLDDGRVQLKAKKVTLGIMPLPITELLNYVDKLGLPTWADVDSENDSIILYLNQIQISNGITMQADKIDLKNDTIRINVYLPYGEDS